MARKKKFVLNDQIKTVYVPQYKNLTLEKILEFIAEHNRVELFLPDDIDLPKVPKQWIVNICAAVLGPTFKNWVTEQIEDHHILMAEKKEVMIAMDPMIAEKFHASSHVSSK